jgi:hypothetical protein
VDLRSIQAVRMLAQPRLFGRASVDRGAHSGVSRRPRSPSARDRPVMPADRGERGLTAGRARPIQRAGLARGWRGLRREAHLSAEQHRPQAPAWLSRAHGDGRRPAGAGAAPRQGAQAPVGLNGARRLGSCLGRRWRARGSGATAPGGAAQASGRVSRGCRDTTPLGEPGVRAAGGTEAGGGRRRGRRGRDRHGVHRQPAGRQGGCA